MAHKKTVTFAMVHMLIAFSVVWALTGSPALGGLVALIEPTCNTIAYFFHEKVWERFTHKQNRDSSQPVATASARARP